MKQITSAFAIFARRIRALCAFAASIPGRIEELISDFAESIPEMLDEFSRDYGGKRIESEDQRLERLYKQFLRRDQIMFGKHHYYSARTMLSLADFYKERRRYGEARVWYVRAVAVLENHFQPGEPRLTEAYRKAARYYEAYYQHDVSESFYNKAIESASREPGDKKGVSADDLRGLTRVRWAQAKFALVEESLLAELALVETECGVLDERLFSLVTELARLYRDWGKEKEELRANLRFNRLVSVSIGVKALGSDNPALMRDLEALHSFLLPEGNQKTLSLLSDWIKLLRLVRKVSGADYPGLPSDLRALADLYDKRAQGGDLTVAFHLRAKAKHILEARKQPGNRSGSRSWR